MREIDGQPPAIVRTVDARAEMGAEMARCIERIRVLRRQAGEAKNLLWPAECRARSGGATAGIYETEIAILEAMVAEGDTSFENWRRHGGDCDPGFDGDGKGMWDFCLWRFGSHMEERDRLRGIVRAAEDELALLRARYEYLLAKVKRMER